MKPRPASVHHVQYWLLRTVQHHDHQAVLLCLHKGAVTICVLHHFILSPCMLLLLPCGRRLLTLLLVWVLLPSVFTTSCFECTVGLEGTRVSCICVEASHRGTHAYTSSLHATLQHLTAQHLLQASAVARSTVHTASADATLGLTAICQSAPRPVPMCVTWHFMQTRMAERTHYAPVFVTSK